jgi:hypothetical protein
VAHNTARWNHSRCVGKRGLFRDTNERAEHPVTKPSENINKPPGSFPSLFAEGTVSAATGSDEEKNVVNSLRAVFDGVSRLAVLLSYVRGRYYALMFLQCNAIWECNVTCNLLYTEITSARKSTLRMRDNKLFASNVGQLFLADC